MKDSLGNTARVGDIFIEETGGGCIDGKDFRSFTLWEFPPNYDGHGFHYHIDGSKSLFAWTNVENSQKLNIKSLPKDLVFSFYHGLGSFDSQSTNNDIVDILEKSNYKEKLITKTDVENYNNIRNLELESLEDVKNNLNLLLMSKYTPSTVVYKILNLFETSPTKVNNGEIGIAHFFDTISYYSLLESLKVTTNEKS